MGLYFQFRRFRPRGDGARRGRVGGASDERRPSPEGARRRARDAGDADGSRRTHRPVETFGSGVAMNEDPYAVLGLDSSATAEAVRQAYFRSVRVYTPEAHPEEFKRVRAAYDTLRSPLRR